MCVQGEVVKAAVCKAVSVIWPVVNFTLGGGIHLGESADSHFAFLTLAMRFTFARFEMHL